MECCWVFVGGFVEVLRYLADRGRKGRFWIGTWIIDLGALPCLWKGFGRARRGEWAWRGGHVGSWGRLMMRKVV